MQDVARYVRIAYGGQVVTSLRYGDEDVDFRVLLEKRARRRLVDLKRLEIPNNRGRLIPLAEVATLKSVAGVADIRHFDGDRSISIEADVNQEKITPLDVMNAIFSHFDTNRDWPGMHIEPAGELFETEQSMRALSRAFLIALVGIYFTLVLLFNSFTQPFLVMAAIPFGIMGVIAAFGFHNETFSFMSVLGIIGLCGVVVNDSLVLVDHINDLNRQDPDRKKREIVAEGTADRLRAVLLTTITTVAAILPLAYGLGGTSPFMAPLALALGWGLVFATPLTLLLVPSLFLIREDIHSIFKRKTKKQ